MLFVGPTLLATGPALADGGVSTAIRLRQLVVLVAESPLAARLLVGSKLPAGRPVVVITKLVTIVIIAITIIVTAITFVTAKRPTIAIIKLSIILIKLIAVKAAVASRSKQGQSFSH